MNFKPKFFLPILLAPLLTACVTGQSALQDNSKLIKDATSTLRIDLVELRKSKNSDPRVERLNTSRARLLYGYALDAEMSEHGLWNKVPSTETVLCHTAKGRMLSNIGLNSIDAVEGILSTYSANSKLTNYALIGEFTRSYKNEIDEAFKDIATNEQKAEKLDEMLIQRCMDTVSEAEDILIGANGVDESALLTGLVLNIDNLKTAYDALGNFVGLIAGEIDKARRTKAIIDFIQRDDVQLTITQATNAVADEFSNTYKIQRLSIARKALILNRRLQLAYSSVITINDKNKGKPNKPEIVEKKIKQSIDPHVSSFVKLIAEYDAANNLRKPAAIRNIGKAFARAKETSKKQMYELSLKNITSSFELAKKIIKEGKETKKAIKNADLNAELKNLKSVLKELIN